MHKANYFHAVKSLPIPIVLRDTVDPISKQCSDPSSAHIVINVHTLDVPRPVTYDEFPPSPVSEKVKECLQLFMLNNILARAGRV